MVTRLEGWAQTLADKVLHELPEELARDLSFAPHHDGLQLSYPLGLHGTPEMATLNQVVRGHGGSFVSRGDGKPCFMFPKPQPVFKDVPLPPAASVEPPKPVDAKTAVADEKGAKTVQSNNVAESQSDKVTTSPPASEDGKPTPPPTESQPQPVRQVPSCPEDFKNPDYVKPLKQPSPITQFQQRLCSVCEDSGEKCNSRTASGREVMARCQEALRLQALEDVNGGIAALAGHLKAVAVALDKLASRPAYRGSGGRSAHPLPVERHEDGGIKWLYDTNQRGERYEKALESENKDRPAYAALKKMIEDSVTAGKKGVLDGGGKYWCFLSTQRDWIGRKPAKVFSDDKGGSKQ